MNCFSIPTITFRQFIDGRILLYQMALSPIRMPTENTNGDMLSDFGPKSMSQNFCIHFEPVAARSDPAANELRLVGVDYLCIHVTGHGVKRRAPQILVRTHMYVSELTELDLTFVMFFLPFPFS